ncbi:hypothetical protein ACFL08_02845 [Patescibacteria group bacterium]
MRIYINDVVKEMQGAFMSQGLMKPVKLQRFIEHSNLLVEGYRKSYSSLIRQEWEHHFPGIAFSEEKLQVEVNKALERKKAEAIKEFKQEVRKKEEYRIIADKVILRKWDYYLILSAIAFILVFPFSLEQFFAPSDWQMGIGFAGMLGSIIIVMGVFLKAKSKAKALRR